MFKIVILILFFISQISALPVADNDFDENELQRNARFSSASWRSEKSKIMDERLARKLVEKLKSNIQDMNKEEESKKFRSFRRKTNVLNRRHHHRRNRH